MQTEMKNIWQVDAKDGDADDSYKTTYLVIGTETQIKRHLVKEFNEYVDLNLSNEQYMTTENQIKKNSHGELSLSLQLGKEFAEYYIAMSASQYDGDVAIYNINDDGILITQNGSLLR